MEYCKAREPRVIDNDLISKCIPRHMPKGERGRLAQEEGIPMDELTEISFEYMYILKIDHLWVLPALTKLCLNNNFIEKIENLEPLVHLMELDLSFNKISKIENLDHLVQMEKLSFYDNLIEVIENMDKMVNLRIFSIGRNKIKDKSNVLYLRKFENLTSLNMAQNPCSKWSDFRLYIATFLPQLIYYEYIMIATVEREQGETMFKEELTVLKEKDEDNRLQKQIEEEKRESDRLDLLAFVENLGHGELFEMMFKDDPEGQLLLLTGDETEDMYEEFKEEFNTSCTAIYQAGHKYYEMRKNEIIDFKESIEDAKKNTQVKSIAIMETFLEEKKEILQKLSEFHEIEESISVSLSDHMEEEAMDTYEEKMHDFKTVFINSKHKAWKQLMLLQLIVYEQVEEQIQNLERTLNEICSAFIEEAQANFTLIRISESKYLDSITEVALKYFNTVNASPDKMDEKLKDIMEDKEALNNALGATHDIHSMTIDFREDDLVRNSREWLNKTMKDFVDEEVMMNRQKVLEISNFLKYQQGLFDEHYSDMISDINDSDSLLFDTLLTNMSDLTYYF